MLKYRVLKEHLGFLKIFLIFIIAQSDYYQSDFQEDVETTFSVGVDDDDSHLGTVLATLLNWPAQTLDLGDCWRLTTKSLRVFFGKWPKENVWLEKLILRNTNICDWSLENIGSSVIINTLAYLDISGCKLLSAQSLIAFISAYPQDRSLIKSLKLGKTNINDQGLILLGKSSITKELVYINLESCDHITSFGIKGFLNDWMAKNTLKKQVSIRQTKTEDTVLNIFNNDLVIPFIQKLDISFCQLITDVGIATFFNEFSQRNTSLNEIYFSKLNIGDKSMQAMVESPASLYLRQLHIAQSCMITDVGFQTLFTQLQPIQGQTPFFLIDLDISGTKIGDGPLIKFCENEAFRCNIIQLNLSFCFRLSAIGIQNFLTQLFEKDKNCSLEELSMQDTQIDEYSIQELVKLCENIPKLKNLILINCKLKIKPQLSEEFEKKLSNVKMILN